ncbi:MAG TPA: hypothetical protein VKT78_18270 [Fimbriimonadaceae bacterium]|nr:hypothetical protein [Fimbriimonadaceae bacterium]
MSPIADAAQDKAPRRGNSLPIIAIILIGLMLACVLLMALGAAVLFPVFRQARMAARRNDAISRMHNLATAVRAYVADNDDHFPPAEAWMDLIGKYDPNGRDFHSPGMNRRNGFDPPDYGIAFMSSLSGGTLSTIKNPDSRVMLFDSTLRGRNATSGLETLPKPPRFGPGETGGNILAFVDGHVRRVSAVDAVNLK